MSLDSEHLADLRRSGLSDDTIQLAHVRSLPPGELSRLGRPFKAVRSAMEFQYHTADGTLNGYRRLKLFPPAADGKGHHIRYYQEPGTSPHLYYAPQVIWSDIVPDPTKPVVITEGEKKTLALAQLGLAALGIGGVWSWMAKHKYQRLVLPELDLIVWQGRPVEICPDNDVWERDDLLRAVFALGMQLTRRGALVRLVRVP
jgi:hypothetical protein